MLGFGGALGFLAVAPVGFRSELTGLGRNSGGLLLVGLLGLLHLLLSFHAADGRSSGTTPGKSSGDFVFTAPNGGPLRLNNFRRGAFDAAARSADLTGLRPHELRHTAASLAVSAGANVKSVQRMLGHASAAMTLDVYSGLFDADLDAVAERMSAAVTEARVPPSCPDPQVIDLDERRVSR